MLKKLDQAFSKVEGFLSVVLFLAMVAIVCWSVICRYALKIPFLQSEELARYLMIYIVYIGTSIGVKSKSHIGVEVFVDMLPEKIYKKVRIFTEILCMLMFVLLFVLSLQMFNHDQADDHNHADSHCGRVLLPSYGVLYGNHSLSLQH